MAERIQSKHYHKGNQCVQIHLPVSPGRLHQLCEKYGQGKGSHPIAEPQMIIKGASKGHAPVGHACPRVYPPLQGKHLFPAHVAQQHQGVYAHGQQKKVSDKFRIAPGIRIAQHKGQHTEQHPVYAGKIEAVKKHGRRPVFREQKKQISCHGNTPRGQKPQYGSGIFALFPYGDNAAADHSGKKHGQYHDKHCFHCVTSP